MARSAKGHQDEFDDDDEEELLTANNTSSKGWHCGNFSDLFVTMRNNHGPAENTTDPSQATQNGSVDEKNNNVSPLLPKNVQNPIESDFSMTTIQKGNIPGSTTEAVPLPMQMRLDMFDPVVSSSMATQHLLEPVSNVNMLSHTQPQLWLDKRNKGNYILPHNDTMKEQEELVNESGSDSISSAYSQGILDSLTQALHSSGVDMSQTNVSVQIDVGRQENAGLIPSASTSKGHENQSVSNPAIAHSGVDYCNIDSEQSSKRLRQEAS
ncbi:hypothetical protein JHK85_052460 [Glycine max]|nr:hypothetical protein JHK85_052460 [Glycine max]